MEHFDVAIIGLGPAGSALARQLSGKMRVLALDKKRQSGTEGFTKPCGGLLAPDAQRSFIREGSRCRSTLSLIPKSLALKRWMWKRR